MSTLLYRILKWTILSVLALLLLLVVAFSIFILNPFEGSLESLDDIVPDSMNLYAAKEVADEEAAGFLKTDFWKRLTATRAYQIWIRSPEWRQSGAAAGLEDLFTRLNVVESSYRVDPLAEVASREIGVGLRFRQDAPPDFLLFLRLSFMARAYLALIQHEVFRDIMNLPIRGVEKTKVLNIRLQDGGHIQDLYMTRLRDVLVVGSNLDLVKTTRTLADGKGKGFPHRVGNRPGGKGNPVGFRMSPEPGHHAALWSRFVVPPTLDELSRIFLQAVDPAGLTGLEGSFYLSRSPHLTMDADFHPGSFRPFQTSLLASPAPDLHRDMEPFLKLAPRELMAMAYFHMKPREAATFAEDSLDPETRKLVEDALGPTTLKSLHNLLDRWLGTLGTGFALFLNRQDLERAPTNPPWPGVTLVFRMEDSSLWQKVLHHDILDHLKEDLAVRDVRLEQPRPDVDLMFYDFQNNPYGDVVAPSFGRFGNLLAFSTSAPFLRRMADIHLDPDRYGLNRSGEVDALFKGRKTLDPDASLFLFLDVRRSLGWVNDMAPSWAQAASLSRQLDNAQAKRKMLEFQARSLRHLKSPREKEAWVDKEMARWYEDLKSDLKRRTDRVVGPMVKHLGILHTLALTLAPGQDAAENRIRVKTTLNFDT